MNDDEISITYSIPLQTITLAMTPKAIDEMTDLTNARIVKIFDGLKQMIQTKAAQGETT